MWKKSLALLLCLLSLVSLAGCGKSGAQEGQTLRVTAAKNAYNPLTGENNLATDRVGTRPVFIMVNNVSMSWPLSGVSQADVLIEIEAEGGITRFGALYSDTREIANIGSLRSIRDYFIETVCAIDPIYSFIGTSIWADDAIEQYGIASIDGMKDNSFAFLDEARAEDDYATEHCWFTSGRRIQSAVEKLELDDRSHASISSFFSFATAKNAVRPSDGDAARVQFVYSVDENYDGDFRYDAASKTYLKYQRDTQQIDVGDGTQSLPLAFTNVLVLFARIKLRDLGTNTVLVDYQAGGEGYYFTGGSYERFTWTKPDFSSNFVMTKLDGSPLMLNPGKTMFCVARDSNIDTLKLS